MYDVLIKNGMVIDGTGAAAKPLDVACKDGRVYMLEPGSCFSAREIIDAAGLWVSPGFIDTHSHEISLMAFPAIPSRKFPKGLPPIWAGSAACRPFHSAGSG